MINDQLSISIKDFDIEDGLIGLENHAIKHFEVLIKVKPSSISTRLAVVAVNKDPLALDALNVSLSL